MQEYITVHLVTAFNYRLLNIAGIDLVYGIETYVRLPGIRGTGINIDRGEGTHTI